MTKQAELVPAPPTETTPIMRVPVVLPPPNPAALLAIDEPFDGYWLPDIADDEYHADREHVSSSQLRTIQRSGASFLANFQTRQGKQTPAMAFGSMAHKVILEAGIDTYTAVPARIIKGWGKANSKKYKESRANWIATVGAEHKTIIKEADLDILKGMYDAVYNHEDAASLLSEGQAELSGYHVDPETGIACRIRPDFLHTSANAIVDLKTTLDCSPRRFSLDMNEMGYHIQLAMYGAGFEAIEGVAPEFYVFIAVEKTKPFEVAVYQVEAATIELGYQEYRDCLARLRQCIDTNTWPVAYPNIQNIGLPAWRLNRS